MWARWIEPKDGKPGYWAHNHLEIGHSDRERPPPHRDAAGKEYKNQSESGAKGTWRKRFGHLNAESVFIASDGDVPAPLRS